MSSITTRLESGPNYCGLSLTDLSVRNSAIGCDCTSETSAASSESRGHLVINYTHEYSNLPKGKKTTDIVRQINGSEFTSGLLPQLRFSLEQEGADPITATVRFLGQDRLTNGLNSKLGCTVIFQEFLNDLNPTTSIGFSLEPKTFYKIRFSASTHLNKGQEEVTFSERSFKIEPNSVTVFDLTHTLEDPLENSPNAVDGEKLTDMSFSANKYMIGCKHGKVSLTDKGVSSKLKPTSVLAAGLETITPDQKE